MPSSMALVNVVGFTAVDDMHMVGTKWTFGEMGKWMANMTQSGPSFELTQN